MPVSVPVGVGVRVSRHGAVGADMLVFVLVLMAVIAVLVAGVIVRVAVRGGLPTGVDVGVRGTVIVPVPMIVRVLVSVA
jgi:hypothetical protein